MRAIHLSIPLLLGLLLSFTSTAAGQVGPPTMWKLYQTDPNPFCRDDDGSVIFAIDTPRAATLSIRVWDPLHAQVLSDVITTSVPAAGHLRVTWDVRDNNSVALPDGIYPYEVQATDGPDGLLLYEETMVMSVTCAVGVESRTWGTVKKLFN